MLLGHGEPGCLLDVHCITGQARVMSLQVIVNYASSSGPAEEVAQVITDSGGEAITIGADISKPAEVDR